MMKRVSETKRKEYIVYVAFIVVQVAFIFLLNKYHMIQYETDDDFYLNSFVSGMFGDTFHGNMYNNVIYCYFIYILYKLLPICNWMIISYYILVTFSYVLLFYIFKCRNITCGKLLVFIFYLLTYYDFICTINFTRIACFITIAGAYVIHYFIFYEDKKILLVAGVILVVFGSMIRPASSILALFFISFIYISSISYHNVNRLGWMLVPILFLLVTHVISNNYYDSDGWDTSFERAELLSPIIDHAVITDEALENIDWNNVGITEEDFSFMMSWRYSDKNVFSNEVLKRLNEYGEKRTVSIGSLQAYIKDTYTRVIGYTAFLISIFFLLIGKMRKRELLLVLLCMVSLFFVIDYFYIIARAANRVCIIPIVGLLMVVFHFILDKSIEKNIYYGIIGVLIMLNVITPMVNRIEATKNTNYSEVENFLYLKENVDTVTSDNLFIVNKNPVYEYYSTADILGCPQKGLFKNCILEEGWTSILPMQYQLIENHGIKDSYYNAAVKCKHIYLVDDENGLDLKRDFIRRNYDLNTDISWVYSVGDCDAYSISSVPNISSEQNLFNWNLVDLKKNNQTGFDFYLISGNIEDDGGEYFAIISNDSKKYCYEIRCENGRFVFGVPADTWGGESASIQIIRQDNQVVADSNVQDIEFTFE